MAFAKKSMINNEIMFAKKKKKKISFRKKDIGINKRSLIFKNTIWKPLCRQRIILNINKSVFEVYNKRLSYKNRSVFTMPIIYILNFSYIKTKIFNIQWCFEFF